jgi:hypothetical protein
MQMRRGAEGVAGGRLFEEVVFGFLTHYFLGEIHAVAQRAC